MRFGGALWKTMHVIISLPLTVYLQRIWRQLWFLSLLPHPHINIHREDSLLAVAARGPQTWLIWESGRWRNLFRASCKPTVSQIHPKTVFVHLCCQQTHLFFKWFFFFVFCLIFSSGTFTLQCCSVSARANGLMVRLVMVKITTVEWVRAKQSAPLSCSGAWWTLQTQRGGESCLPWAALVITRFKFWSSPCRTRNWQHKLWHIFPSLKGNQTKTVIELNSICKNHNEIQSKLINISPKWGLLRQ